MLFILFLFFNERSKSKVGHWRSCRKLRYSIFSLKYSYVIFVGNPLLLSISLCSFTLGTMVVVSITRYFPILVFMSKQLAFIPKQVQQGERLWEKLILRSAWLLFLIFVVTWNKFVSETARYFLRLYELREVFLHCLHFICAISDIFLQMRWIKTSWSACFSFNCL